MVDVLMSIILIFIVINQIIHTFMLRDIQDNISNLYDYAYRVSDVLSDFNKVLRNIKMKVNINNEE